MNHRLAAAFVALSLFAACSADSASTTSQAGPPSTTDPAPGVALASYSLEAGTSFTYEVGIEQDITMNVEGDTSTIGEEDFPGDSEIKLTGSATFTQTVSDGPRPGTFEVRVVGEFTDLTVTGTIEGEPVDEVPEFADLSPIDSTFVVDEKGLIIGSDTGLEDPLGGLVDPGAFDPTSMPGLDPGRFLGPELPDTEVGVGDSWETDSEFPGLGADPVVVSSSSTVTGTDDIDGVEVLVIETSTSTSRIEVDFGELLLGMFGALAPEDMEPEEAEEFDELLESLKFLIFIDDAISDATSWVDPVAGVVWQSQSASSTSMGIDVSVPDQETGELIEATVDMALRQDITYRLTEGPSA